MKRGDCGCRNRKGTHKMKFPDKEAALTAIIRYYCHNAGGAVAYECPRMEGVWHIRTDRRGKS